VVAQPVVVERLRGAHGPWAAYGGGARPTEFWVRLVSCSSASSARVGP
jgi:hypothetical protein